VRTTATQHTTEKPYDIYFSHDPFDQTLELDIAIKGDHPTLGIQTNYCPYRQRLQIKDMALGTPGSRMKKWRSTMRNAYILKLQEFHINTADDLEHAVKQLRLRSQIKAKILVATDRTYGVHPIDGIQQIYFDQMNIIAKHLEEITTECQQQQHATIHALSNGHTPESIITTAEPASIQLPTEEQVAQSFTKKQLLKRSDWHEWEQGQFKQLDQYWNQGMFGNPLPLPKNSNALRMLWRYNLKACGTKKSRMVCNGSPKQQGTVTLGHT
jgi:hypothetical protein